MTAQRLFKTWKLQRMHPIQAAKQDPAAFWSLQAFGMAVGFISAFAASQADRRYPRC